MTANQIGRRAAMYQSLSYIAKAQRRRVIRVRQFEEEQARIRLIVRRAAAIFGEEGLPYVPVEKRYKPMARA
jgi:transposase InsO family protein